MTVALALLQNKYVQYGIAAVGTIVVLLVLWTNLQRVLTDKAAIAAKLKESQLAYTHMAQLNTSLQTQVTSLKRNMKKFTVTIKLPNGTIITTTSEYIDTTSSISSTTSTTGQQVPVFNNPVVATADRYPFVVSAMINKFGWGVGPGWDAIRVNLPLLPYTNIAMAIPVGQTFSSSGQPAWLVSGVINLSWSRGK